MNLHLPNKIFNYKVLNINKIQNSKSTNLEIIMKWKKMYQREEFMKKDKKLTQNIKPYLKSKIVSKERNNNCMKRKQKI